MQENNYSTEAQNYADVENYAIPLGMATNSALHISGVADDLTVSAAEDGTEVKVSPGTALDPQGRLMVLAEGGLVATDDPDNGAEDPHTLTVQTNGVTLPTTGREPGNYRLTISWGEIEKPFKVMGTIQSGLAHAPWLRLVPEAEDAELQVVLAHVTLGTGGLVKDVTVGSRHSIAVPAEYLELRRPLLTPGAVRSVGHATAAKLTARPDGGVDLNLVSAGGTEQTALSVAGASGKIRMPAGAEVGPGPVDCAGGLRITSTASGLDKGLQLRNTAPGSRTYGLYAGTDNSLHFADKDAGQDRFLIDWNGNVGIGLSQPKRSLHVEGTEVHSGGSAGGYSFADRTASSGAFVETPSAGQRWTWYAQGGRARLWSGSDQITVGTGGEGDALDVPRRMRV
ncbi:hypothetical protein ABT040_29885, partial [Streptomyces sp. NPDC002688]|uniref:hypothetical protein n=1 Tax=Streptomyces sp. NPDC002688 TaxID=3154423 RepID=UPI00332E7CE6